MRHPHRRIPALAAAFALVAAGLTACAIPQAGTDDPRSITVWTSYTGPGQTGAMAKQNKMFEKLNPGWSVNVVQVPGEQMDQKLLASAASKTGPDILLNNIVVDFPTLVGGNVLADQTKYWNAYDQKDQFPDSAVWKSDGRVYNVMSYTNLVGLYYNEDILKQYGIDPPTTVDELEKAMATVEKGGKYEGMALSGASNVEGAWLFFPLLLGQGVGYCNAKPSELKPEFERYRSWVDKGWMPRAASTWSQGDAWQKFMTGKFAFSLNGNWNLQDAAQNASFKWGTGQYPANGNGKSVVFPGGEGLGIGKWSKHKDMAWKYLEDAWLAKDASIVDYKLSGQIPVRADVAKDPEIASDTKLAPFLAAAQSAGTWPQNLKTADMQNGLGQSVSAVISGQERPGGAADQAIENIADARKAGGGEC